MSKELKSAICTTTQKIQDKVRVEEGQKKREFKIEYKRKVDRRCTERIDVINEQLVESQQQFQASETQVKKCKREISKLKAEIVKSKWWADKFIPTDITK